MTPPAPLRIAIAEDEPLARRALRRMLLADGAVEIVAEVDDIPTLDAHLHSDRITDVLFVDINMPGGSVFDCLAGRSRETLLVFTTAHAEHAALAFDIDAVDYLRKPFGEGRVQEALGRVRRRMADARTSSLPSGNLLVRVGVREIPIRYADVLRFEGADDCVRVVTAERSLLHAATLTELEEQLAAYGFLRVHRRHLVNASAIRALLAHDPHRLAVELPNGDRIVASRRGTAALRAWSAAGSTQLGGGTRS